MKAQVQLQLRILPILIGILILMQLIDPSRVWSILLGGLGGAWVLSALWARSLAQNLRLRREIRFGWAQVGDRLEERFTLDNHGAAPALWVEVLDHSNIPGYCVSQVSDVGGRSNRRWRTDGVCNRRGVFTLGPTSLETSDPFGFYRVRLEDPASMTLVVTPPIVPLPAIEVAPGGHTGHGLPRADAPERTVSSASVRPYVPGDSLRWIHWRTTARRAAPYIRIFDGTPAGDWWIFLDLNARVQTGSGWESTAEHAIILTASLADRGMRLGKAVGLASNSANHIWLPPQEGEHHRWEILRALALAEYGRLSLAELLTRTKPAIGQSTSLVIITPDVSGQWLEALIPLMWRGVVPTVLLINPSTFGVHKEIKPLVASLASLGVTHYEITKDLLDLPEARPGDEGHWEWRISATGRALPLKAPSNLSWKVLS